MRPFAVHEQHPLRRTSARTVAVAVGVGAALGVGLFPFEVEEHRD